ncbi:DnaJ domain-containing protein [Pantanalinema rosaneae CENA516]|uniref:J domain-containing protein n=1 Tax=Pantanalinema rosaneae TaxID=1620701 RepID=UPI003D6EAB61
MNLADCYRVLGLRSGASFDEIKASYRRLVRRYHPDVSTGNQQTPEKFIEVTQAYKLLLNELVRPATPVMPPTPLSAGVRSSPQSSPAPTVAPSAHRKSPPIRVNPQLSPQEQRLKVESYQQLQQFLKQQRFPRAIALVEGLAKRIPQDPEIMQWQAIVYQQWGRRLIQDHQFDKARIYLKKALQTDPHNRSLWAEVERDFRYMEQIV